jgi:hypothetical protein
MVNKAANRKTIKLAGKITPLRAAEKSATAQLPIASAVSFALFAELPLVHARRAKRVTIYIRARLMVAVMFSGVRIWRIPRIGIWLRRAYPWERYGNSNHRSHHKLNHYKSSLMLKSVEIVAVPSETVD